MAPAKGKSSKASVTSSKSVSQKRGRNSKTVKPSGGDDGIKRIKIDHKSHRTEPGVVLTVGEGDVGQLGLGPDVMERSRVGLVELPSKCIQVIAGGMHTACLTVDGQVYTFGCNDEGALGRDTRKEDSETIPDLIDCKLTFVQISAGDSHTAMLTANGEVYACGTFRDANGPIGLTESGPEKKPVHIPCEKKITKIVSGGDHILALSVDGSIYSAGCAEQGQLGRVAECFSNRGGRKGLGHLLKFQQIHFRGSKHNRHPRFDDIWAGTYISFSKATTGDIYGWGLNNYYQLGIDDMENKFVPNLVTSLQSDKQWQCIAGGQHHSVALDKEGNVYSMGRGTYGQLGLGESATDDAMEPMRVSALEEACSSVEASSSVSFALSNTGKAYGWGMGTSKQLSSGNEDDQFEPAVMGGKQLVGRKVLMVSCGGQHTVLLAKDKPDMQN